LIQANLTLIKKVKFFLVFVDLFKLKAHIEIGCKFYIFINIYNLSFLIKKLNQQLI